MNVKPNTCKQAGSIVYKHHWISIKSLVFLFKSIDIIHQLMTYIYMSSTFLPFKEKWSAVLFSEKTTVQRLIGRKIWLASNSQH